MRVALSEKSGVLCVEIDGVVTRNAILAQARVLSDAPPYQNAKSVLVDIHGVTWKLAPGQVEELALTHKLRAVRWATVADGDLSYGISRQFAALAEDGATIRVFRDRKAAIRWLAGSGDE